MRDIRMQEINELESRFQRWILRLNPPRRFREEFENHVRLFYVTLATEMGISLIDLRKDLTEDTPITKERTPEALRVYRHLRLLEDSNWFAF